MRGWRPDTWRSIVVALLLVGAALIAERYIPALTGAVRLADGDSLELGTERIRIEGIDAPELHQNCGASGAEWPCGRRAKEALQKIVDTGEVKCRPVDRDRYGRDVSICEVGGRDLGRAMVEQGFAVAFGTAYLTEERAARTAKRGIWAGPFDMSAEWRARNQ